MSIPTEELGLKQALVKAGQLKPEDAGRGRPAAWMTEAGKVLVTQGWHIKGLSAQTSSRPTGDTTTKPVTEVVRIKGPTILDVGDPRYGEDEWRGYWMDGKKKVYISLRTVCDGPCRNSLTYHFCDTPRVRVDFDKVADVTLERI